MNPYKNKEKKFITLFESNKKFERFYKEYYFLDYVLSMHCLSTLNFQKWTFMVQVNQ